MGLRTLPMIIVQYVVLAFVLTFECIPLVALLKAIFLKKSNPLIIYLAMLLSTVGTFVCFTFYIYVASRGIGLLYLLSIFFKSIVIDPQYVDTPLPGSISYPLTFLIPQQGLGQVLRIANTFESSNGLTFDSINQEIFLNTALYNILAMVASIVVFSLLTIWIWPISHAKDGAKISLCYCCKKSKKITFKQSRRQLIVIAPRSRILQLCPEG